MKVSVLGAEAVGCMITGLMKNQAPSIDNAKSEFRRDHRPPFLKLLAKFGLPMLGHGTRLDTHPTCGDERCFLDRDKLRRRLASCWKRYRAHVSGLMQKEERCSVYCTDASLWSVSAEP